MSTKKLFDILPIKNVTKVIGDDHRVISDLALDSREVKSGYAFIAKIGFQADGHAFIDQAIDKGAQVIFCEELPNILHEAITYVVYTTAEEFIGNLAHDFFDRPSKQLRLIGVTGTNGKSSIVTLLYQTLSALGIKSGLLSTIENKIGDQVMEARLTTPDPISLNRMLQQMVFAGCEYACMEVSSHALDQGRVAGLDFAAAIFTNISHDHLDYHITMQSYIAAKKKLFDNLDKNRIAISNLDDRNGKVMLQNCHARKVYFGLRRPCQYKGKILSNSLQGISLEMNGKEVCFGISGEFNAYNLLAIYALMMEEDFVEEEVLIAMSALKGAEGRFEKVIGQSKRVIGIVDYAHTPDALEKVIQTIQQTKDKMAKLIVIVGCGGNRDKAKRPMMAQKAVSGGDLVILTSDNPRQENPEEILDDMESGIPQKYQDDYLRISDRRQAIKTACKLAKQKDVILVAGKGHEKYQDINGKKFPFDDKKILENELL